MAPESILWTTMLHFREEESGRNLVEWWPVNERKSRKSGNIDFYWAPSIYQGLWIKRWIRLWLMSFKTYSLVRKIGVNHIISEQHGEFLNNHSHVQKAMGTQRVSTSSRPGWRCQGRLVWEGRVEMGRAWVRLRTACEGKEPEGKSEGCIWGRARC